MLTGQKYENPLQGQDSIEQKVKSATPATALTIGVGEVGLLYSALASERSRLFQEAGLQQAENKTELFLATTRDIETITGFMDEVFQKSHQRAADLAQKIGQYPTEQIELNGGQERLSIIKKMAEVSEERIRTLEKQLESTRNRLDSLQANV